MTQVVQCLLSKRIRVVAVLVMSDLVAQAQGPQLILDITPGAISSYFGHCVIMDGIAFTGAGTPEQGNELWRTDATVAGTYLVKDILPGTEGSFVRYLNVVEDILYFNANDAVHGRELWRSDGTEAGTSLVKDIMPSDSSGNPWHLCDLNGLLLFNASTSDAGDELWRSDGSEAGTYLVRDIRPGIEGSVADGFIVFDDLAFFSADNGVNGSELWRTDGTAIGTMMVKDIWPGSTGSYPSDLCVVGGELYFSARDPDHGIELWRSDGTEGGTWLVKDIAPGSFNHGAPSLLVDLDGTLLFSADNGPNGRELWRSDGTEAGTVMLGESGPGDVSGMMFTPELCVANGLVFFTANDGWGVAGSELYASDGQTVYPVKDIRPGPSGSAIISIHAGCGGVLFGANDGTTGRELWRSNGTEVGTYMVGEIVPGGAGVSQLDVAVVLGDEAIIRAQTDELGMEPWKYICGISGISETDVAEALRLVPNPTAETLRVELPDADAPWSIAIYDATGKLTYQDHTAVSTCTVDVRAWSKGLYNVVVKSGTVRVAHNVVVE